MTSPMERCIMMNVKKIWILTAIMLVFCTFGFCNTEALAAGKNIYQKKSVKVSPKYVRRRAAAIRLRNTAVYNQLKKTVDLSALTLDTPFSKAIDLLRNSAEPPLKIVVLWRDLRENANVEPDTPIRIDGVSGIQIRTGLEILLMAVSGSFAKLGYIIDNGIIIIATKQSLHAKMITKVYNISDLLARPARYGFGFGPGMLGGWPMGLYGRRGQMVPGGQTNGTVYGRRGAGRLADVIRDTVQPNRWR